MARFILNSAVLTAFGRWEYQPLSIEAATSWLREAQPWCDDRRCEECGHATGERFSRWISAIGYPETATALEQLCGLAPGTIPVNRQTIQMAVGDSALVFRLVFPAGTRPDAVTKGGMGLAFIAAHCELGLLRRLA